MFKIEEYSSDHTTLVEIYGSDSRTEKYYSRNELLEPFQRDGIASQGTSSFYYKIDKIYYECSPSADQIGHYAQNLVSQKIDRCYLVEEKFIPNNQHFHSLRIIYGRSC